MLNKLKKDSKGFTIIEVMIVLAIAGLIMLIVFLAVPALQRNSRNTARRSDIGQLLSQLQNEVTNANGTAPGACNGSTATCWVRNVKTAQYDNTTANVSWAGALPATLPTAPTADQVFIYSGAHCNGTSPAVDTNSRKMAAWAGLETAAGTATTCVES